MKTVVFEYVSSANEKEAKEAKAKIKKEEEKRELARTLEASCGSRFRLDAKRWLQVLDSVVSICPSLARCCWSFCWLTRVRARRREYMSPLTRGWGWCHPPLADPSTVSHRIMHAPNCCLFGLLLRRESVAISRFSRPGVFMICPAADLFLLANRFCRWSVGRCYCCYRDSNCHRKTNKSCCVVANVAAATPAWFAASFRTGHQPTFSENRSFRPSQQPNLPKRREGQKRSPSPWGGQ